MPEPVIVSAVRTPMGSFLGSLSTVEAPDLGAVVVNLQTPIVKVANQLWPLLVKIVQRLASRRARRYLWQGAIQGQVHREASEKARRERIQRAVERLLDQLR